MGEVWHLFLLFLRFGATAFGGPAAHIAMLEELVVRQRQWLERAHFLDLLGLTQLLPGPNSTELVLHCGFERRGWWGLVAAGLGFMLPGVLSSAALAVVYAQGQDLAWLHHIFAGIQPVVVGIIAAAAWQLGQQAVKHLRLGLIGGLALVLGALGYAEIWVILLAGLLGVLLAKPGPRASSFGFWALAAGSWKLPLGIFGVFLKIGGLLYGSGYALIAYLDQELVVERGWTTREVLLDAVAIGQITPGPLFSTATFLGYQMGGWAGAGAATVGIFLPAFVMVGLVNPLTPRLRRSARTAAFLDAVNVASVAVMVLICWQLGQPLLAQPWKLGLAALTGVGLVRFPRWGSAFWIILGALIGTWGYLFA